MGLPVTKNWCDDIITWVVRLTRRVHFIRSRRTGTAVDPGNIFFRNIFSQHGLSDNIASNRNPKLFSKSSKQLMSLCEVQLKMSSSKRPQTDGASEVLNRMMENYLRCYCSYDQNDCDELLPTADFAYNSAVSEDLGMSPFEFALG